MTDRPRNGKFRSSRGFVHAVVPETPTDLPMAVEVEMGAPGTGSAGTTGTGAGEAPLFPGPATSSTLDRWVRLNMDQQQSLDTAWPVSSSDSDSEGLPWARARSPGEDVGCPPAPEPANRAVLSASIRLIIATWRAAERELAGTPLDSPGWASANARLTDLRASYHRLFDEYRAPRPGERAG
jgi:hypothetical protein